jgi:pyrophosphatase PpaX
MFSSVTTLLFDIDGTLLDTSEFIIQAYEYTFKLYGIPSPEREAIRKSIGKPLDECYKKFIPLRVADVQLFIETHKQFQLTHLHLSHPFEDTMHTLTELRGRGFKMAACTTRSKLTVFDTLKNADISDFFEIIVCLEDTSLLKPHPEPLIKALAYMKRRPSEAVMIGDSHVDIVAGKNAGTKTIRALYGVNQEHLHDPEPDAHIHSIADVLELLPTHI